MTEVEFFVDPSCPWAWITAQWVREVAPQRDLTVTWRSHCLEIRDDYDVGPHIPADRRDAVIAAHALSHRMLRIFEAARAEVGEAAVDALYAAWGPRFFVEKGRTDDVLIACLAACGLDPALIAAATDEKWDAPIIDSMAVAYAFGGEKTQTPTIVVRDDPPHGFKGPVMAPRADRRGRVALVGRDPGRLFRARRLRIHPPPRQRPARHLTLEQRTGVTCPAYVPASHAGMSWGLGGGGVGGSDHADRGLAGEDRHRGIDGVGCRSGHRHRDLRLDLRGRDRRVGLRLGRRRRRVHHGGNRRGRCRLRSGLGRDGRRRGCRGRGGCGRGGRNDGTRLDADARRSRRLRRVRDARERGHACRESGDGEDDLAAEQLAVQSVCFRPRATQRLGDALLDCIGVAAERAGQRDDVDGAQRERVARFGIAQAMDDVDVARDDVIDIDAYRLLPPRRS